MPDFGKIGLEDLHGGESTDSGTTFSRTSRINPYSTATLKRPFRYYDIRTFTNLDAAISAIGSTEATLLINADTTMADDVTIPSTLSVVVEYPGTIDQGVYALTINGPFTAPLAQVFTGSGAVTFGITSTKEIYPEWWGANSTVDSKTSLQAALTCANDSNIPLMLNDVYLSSAKLTIVRPSSDKKGIQLFGRGRDISGIKYTGSDSIGTLLDIDGTGSGWTLNNHLNGFQLDLTDAPAGTIGLKINAGVWRSVFENLYVFRDVPGGGRTGTGIYMGSGTASDVGCFDNKFSKLYIANFSKNIHFQGTDLSGNTITNCPIDHSYISGGDYNLYVDYYNGLSVNNSQFESAQDTAIYLANGETFVVLGGSIESIATGAKGIDMDSNTKSVIAICDFYNNDGGHFITNNKIGHFYKTTNSGFVFPSGAELRIDSDGTNQSYIRFFNNGVADVRFKPSNTADAMLITNAAGTTYFTINMGSQLLSADNGAYFRINNGTGIAGIYSYHGSPEGNVTAGPGSICLDTTGGAGNSFYVKESGSGNTGWVAK